MIIAAYIVAIALQLAKRSCIAQSQQRKRTLALNIVLQVFFFFFDHQNALTIKRLYSEYIFIYLYK